MQASELACPKAAMLLRPVEGSRGQVSSVAQSGHDSIVDDTARSLAGGLVRLLSAMTGRSPTSASAKREFPH